jgi:hypothetical protein
VFILVIIVLSLSSLINCWMCIHDVCLELYAELIFRKEQIQIHRPFLYRIVKAHAYIEESV